MVCDNKRFNYFVYNYCTFSVYFFSIVVKSCQIIYSKTYYLN